MATELCALETKLTFETSVTLKIKLTNQNKRPEKFIEKIYSKSQIDSCKTFWNCAEMGVFGEMDSNIT